MLSYIFFGISGFIVVLSSMLETDQFMSLAIWFLLASIFFKLDKI